jgi:hypothetical protein
MNAETTPGASAVVVIVQTAVVAGAVVKPPARELPKGPCPPAAESIAACIELGLIADNGDGTFRALMRGRTGPHDDGRVK